MYIQVENGTFSYGKKKILENINFGLDKGQTMAILGPNGVGKTSLVKCISGLNKWDLGCTRIGGQNIEGMTKKDLWQKISYVPQAKAMTFSYTGLEMVLLGLSVNMGIFAQPGEAEINKSYEKMVDLGIGSLAHRNCMTLSGGELQMVLMARALVSDPEIIILDEPESGLDFKNQLVVLDTIESLVSQGGLIAIINTHYPENALAIADKCLLLKKDRTYKFGSTEEILQAENIRDAFGVRVLLNEIKHDQKKYKSIIPLGLSPR